MSFSIIAPVSVEIAPPSRPAVSSTNVSLVAVMVPLLEIAPPSLLAESSTNVTPTIMLPPWVSSAPPLDAESFENVSFVRLTAAESSSSPPPLPVAWAPVIVRSESVILPVGSDGGVRRGEDAVAGGRGHGHPWAAGDRERRAVPARR